MAETSEPRDDLTVVERVALAMTRFANERPLPKRIQDDFLRYVSKSWMRHTIVRRIFVDGMADLQALTPPSGVLLATNHRSFFDQWCVLLSVYGCKVPWAQRLYFPVRANFFYDNPLGIAVNFGMGAGAMYPPVFRQGSRAALNKDATDRLAKFLTTPGTVVGVHPEGTRGKGPDPYELLPAQPGIGQIALHSKPTVIPCFINGVSNDFVGDVIDNYRADVRKRRPCIIVFGEPIDYSDLTAKPPRPALAKRAADRFRDAIAALGARERHLRALANAGELVDDHPDWLPNLERTYAANGHP